MRADAQKNYEVLLTVGRAVILEQGANASLRDIARRASVGMGTLYRHFPTREALLGTLLREGFDAHTVKARALDESDSPGDALVTWLRELVTLANDYRDVVALMVAAIDDPTSALHASCVSMKNAGARLLTRAQEAGTARPDITGADLFALVAALAWLGDQPSLSQHASHLFDVIAGTILSANAA
jgi:AcrR family transcriptional regulator